MWHKHVIKDVDGFCAEMVRRCGAKNNLIFHCSCTVTPPYKSLRERSEVEGTRWNSVWESDCQGYHAKDDRFLLKGVILFQTKRAALLFPRS
jgi:hypothetical protein